MLFLLCITIIVINKHNIVIVTNKTTDVISICPYKKFINLSNKEYSDKFFIKYGSHIDAKTPAKVKIPTIVLSAADDPIIKEEYIDEKELVDKSNQNLAFVFTKEGGHVSFAEGLDGKGSYAEDVAEEFFNLLMKKDWIY